MSGRLLRTIAVVAACAGICATAAQAAVTATLQVTSATQAGSCTAGLATWNINANLVAQNSNATPATLVSAAFVVNATSTALGGPLQYVVTVTADGGLPGTVVGPNATATIQGIVLTTAIPCDTTLAQVCITVSLLDGSQTPQGCADFIENSTPVPMGTVGLLGLTALLGAGLLLLQFRAWLKRRRRRAAHESGRR